MTQAPVSLPGYVAGVWSIDPVHSDVSFYVRHMMVSKVRGEFTEFDAVLTTAPNPLDSHVEATIKLDSISTRNEQRDNHIRSADFFEVDQYPEMTYTSTAVRYDSDEIVVDGQLTLKGITRSVPLSVELSGFGPDAYGGTPAGFSARGRCPSTVRWPWRAVSSRRSRTRTRPAFCTATSSPRT